MTATCTGPDCAEPVRAKQLGLCQAHYMQQWRGEVLRPLRRSPKTPRPPCPEPGCDRLVQLRGRCRRCDARANYTPAPPRKRKRKPCSFDGCDRTVDARDLCHSHYKQILDGKELTPLQKRRRQGEPAPPCSTDDCGEPAYAKDMCRRHYNRAQYQRRKPTAAKRAPKPKPLKLPDNVLPIDRKKPDAGLPPGWFNPSRKPLKPTKPTAKSVGQIIDVPPPNPQLEQMARENLIRLGAEDLLDMLGLAS